MEGIEKIHSLLESLSKTLMECFENATYVSVTTGKDGYINFTVTEWDDKPGIPTEKKLRRELWEQSFVFGEWLEDRSSTQNDYLKECGVLLEGEK